MSPYEPIMPMLDTAGRLHIDQELIAQAAAVRDVAIDGSEGIEMSPEEVVELVKASGLQGRGGAGFNAGLKWSFMPKESDGRPSYLVINADESEPGTFKDREIMESNPFQFIEGVAISCFAVGATEAYLYLRGEFWPVAHFLDEKIAEVNRRMPAHSVKPPIMTERFALEDERDEVFKQLEVLKQKKTGK